MRSCPYNVLYYHCIHSGFMISSASANLSLAFVNSATPSEILSAASVLPMERSFSPNSASSAA